MLKSEGEEASLCAGFIEEGSRRMRDLLSDLLAYTQLAGDGRELEERVNAALALDVAIQNLRAAIGESGASITSDPLPVIAARQVHMVQLFQNLIGNSIKYRGQSAPRIRVSAEKTGSEWRFAIADNGIGIEPEYHQAIFGVFKRLHGHRIPGTGIGLAICRRIVEHWGGRIWVDSHLGEGATFYFTAPPASSEVI
jgi:light-regulated signal transduction histidine kinase (bacteriophytochrome)